MMMAGQSPIGMAKGPGQTPNEYLCVTPDHGCMIKAGEFVYYQAKVNSQMRDVLGRVTKRPPLRLYPDAFLGDPDVSPDEIAKLLGFEAGSHELFEISVVVMGYYDTALEDFVNPRVPPRSGLPIYMASDAMLTALLSKKRQNESGSLHIGSLLMRPGDSVPIVLDAKAITSTHAAIIASTGAGKSYLAGVLLEELLGPHNRAAVLIVDPHGEYGTLAELATSQVFHIGDYQPEVRVLQPKDVKIRISSLSLSEMRYLLPDMSERMHWLLGRAYNEVWRSKGYHWTLDDLLTQVGQEESRKQRKQKDDEGSEFRTNQALTWRLETVFGRSMTFSSSENLDLPFLLRPGLGTVLQLNEIDEREQQVIVAALLRRIFKARVDTEKGIAKGGSVFFLPFPVFVLIEEAHRFAPAEDDPVSSQILKTILSEGRKFGVAVGLISQRPGKLDADVLSQCMTQFIMRIVNPLDQKRVIDSVESVGRDLLQELPALSKGQAIVAGAAVNTPVLCCVRERLTSHGAEDPDAPARWRAYFERRATQP